jgi:tetratricopeptide (TPR) repeat protein
MRTLNKGAAAALIFLAVFALYCRTLNPVFHADDSPETIACSLTLGIQHPPGYPLPTLTGKLFSMIMPGNTGFAVNLQSAAAGAASAMMVFLIMAKVLYGKKSAFDSLAAAASAALCFAMGETVWGQSLSAKGGIYSLNTALLLAIVYSLMHWEETGKVKFLYLASYIFGLSIANHWESMAVAAPALAAYAGHIYIKEGRYRKTNITNVLLFALPGIFAYSYLVIRARGGAFLNWGDPSDLNRLLWVLKRAEYSATETAGNISTVFRQLGRAGLNILSEFTIAGLALAAAGFYCFYKRLNRRLLVFMAVLFFTITAGLSFYFNLKEEMLWIMDVFFIPAYAALAALAGAGMFLLFRRIKDGPAKYAAVLLLASALPAWLLAANFTGADQSANYYAYDFGKNIIRSVGAADIAMLEGDYAVMPLMYMKYAEKKMDFCPVTTVFLAVPWSVKNLRNECPSVKMNASAAAPIGEKIRDIVESNYSDHGICVSVFRPAFSEFYPEGNAALLPHGAVMKMGADKKSGLAEAGAILKRLTYRGIIENRSRMDSTTELGMSNYSSMFMETGNGFSSVNMDDRALFYLTRAGAVSTGSSYGIAMTQLGVFYAKTGKISEALECYKKAEQAGSGTAEAYSNMAGIYNGQKKYDEAIASCGRALALKPEMCEAYNNMAIAWFGKGDAGKAVEFMEKAVAIDPGNELARKNLEAIEAQVKK